MLLPAWRIVIVDQANSAKKLDSGRKPTHPRVIRAVAIAKCEALIVPPAEQDFFEHRIRD
jgi:hypothetical protein